MKCDLNKYKYAAAHSPWTGEIIFDDNGEMLSEDTCLPTGWKELFWQCMEDIYEPLKKANLLDKFFFTQVKEKYGSMRLYNNGATQEVLDIIAAYEYLSEYVCEQCGKPADLCSAWGWIEQYCEECANSDKIRPYLEKLKKIDEINLKPTRVRYTNGKEETIQLDFTDMWERYIKRINKEEKEKEEKEPDMEYEKKINENFYETNNGFCGTFEEWFNKCVDSNNVFRFWYHNMPEDSRCLFGSIVSVIEIPNDYLLAIDFDYDYDDGALYRGNSDKKSLSYCKLSEFRDISIYENDTVVEGE